MKIETCLYTEQKAKCPSMGQHILAAFDDECIVVYQAYNRRIGNFAATNGFFGGDFSFTRMSWIKPNFLWMMYRSGWGTKRNQEVTLAIHLKREFWEEILAFAVPSSFEAAKNEFIDEMAWKKAVESSDVRLQWDPDHAPSGGKVARRALQLGLRGTVLQRYSRSEILHIEDISDFVEAQRTVLGEKGIRALQTPIERVFRPHNEQISQKIGLSIE